MQWILLICAGLLEIGWPLGFKLAGLHEKYFYHFIALSVVSMGLSGFLLYLAQKSIPYRHGIRHLDRNRCRRYRSIGNFLFPRLHEFIPSPFRVF